MERIAAHVERLTSMFIEAIEPFATLYGRTTFNLHEVPYWVVEEEAWKANISLRGGCFCNPGAAELAFGLQSVHRCLDRIGDDFSVQRLAACMDKQVGAVRVSFGIANDEADVFRVVSLIRRCKAQRPAATRALATAGSN